MALSSSKNLILIFEIAKERNVNSLELALELGLEGVDQAVESRRSGVEVVLELSAIRSLIASRKTDLPGRRTP